ncbi:hypothetical protein EJB05_06380, partial [Eragrostis curvula]
EPITIWNQIDTALPSKLHLDFQIKRCFLIAWSLPGNGQNLELLTQRQSVAI